MSAWFFWAAIGMLPENCLGRFALTSPLFDSVTIHRAAGDLTVVSYNNSPTNVYVEKVALNGQVIPSNWVDAQALLFGPSKLEFWMSPTPVL
jgi:putative alpha-1,2-mannosidase